MELVPAGYYRARVSRMTDDRGNEVWARFGRASTGTQQVLMKFEVIEEGDWKGRKLFYFGSFTENSWERTVEGLRYCGFQGDDLGEINQQTLDRDVSIKVEQTANAAGDRTYARVAFINEVGGAIELANPLSGDELRHFAAQMKSKLAGKRPAPATPTDPLDEIPF